MAEDKRKYQRIKSDFNVSLKYTEPGRSMPGINTAKSLNVSAAGVLFRYGQPVKLGNVISIKFLKPNSFDFFEGEAEVIRSESAGEPGVYEIGVQFIGLSEADEKKLSYYISTD